VHDWACEGGAGCESDVRGQDLELGRSGRLQGPRAGRREEDTGAQLTRGPAPRAALGFSPCAFLLADPSALFYVGFLLTFAAVFGLAEFGAPAVAFLRARGAPPLLADAVGATLGAELAVLPVFDGLKVGATPSSGGLNGQA